MKRIILSCQYCGSDSIKPIESVFNGAPALTLLCADCGIMGSFCRTHREAIANWNDKQANEFSRKIREEAYKVLPKEKTRNFPGYSHYGKSYGICGTCKRVLTKGYNAILTDFKCDGCYQKELDDEAWAESLWQGEPLVKYM
jgi:hypothetical protein